MQQHIWPQEELVINPLIQMQDNKLHPVKERMKQTSCTLWQWADSHLIIEQQQKQIII